MEETTYLAVYFCKLFALHLPWTQVKLRSEAFHLWFPYSYSPHFFRPTRTQLNVSHISPSPSHPNTPHTHTTFQIHATPGAQPRRVSSPSLPIVAHCVSLITENKPLTTRPFLFGPKTGRDPLAMTFRIIVSRSRPKSTALKSHPWSSPISSPRARRWQTKVDTPPSTLHSLLSISFCLSAYAASDVHLPSATAH